MAKTLNVNQGTVLLTGQVNNLIKNGRSTLTTADQLIVEEKMANEETALSTSSLATMMAAALTDSISIMGVIRGKFPRAEI